MKFFNQLFAVLYNRYLLKNSSGPRLTATLYVGIIQLFLIFIPLAFLQNIGCLGALDAKGHISKYYFLPVLILWIVLLERYYKQEKADVLLRRFRQKPESYRKFWGWITFLLIVGPLIVMLFLSRNHKKGMSSASNLSSFVKNRPHLMQ